MNNILTKYNFTTIPNNHTLYSWDTNKSFNKIDEFVTKSIIIKDRIGDIMIEQTNNDQVNIQSLEKGNYTMEINYKITIPRYYKDYIYQLQDQYKITLTDRELGILSLKPTIDMEGVQRFWENKAQLYYPSRVQITHISGATDPIDFTTPFGAGIDYTLNTQEDNTTKQILIDFTLTP